MKLIRLLIGIVLICLVCFTAFLFLNRKPVTLTAQATLYMPTDDLYYVQEYNGYMPNWISPDRNGSILGSTAEDDHRVSFRNNVLRTCLDHGPSAICGVFPCSALKEIWHDIPLQTDWPFKICLYNTNSGQILNMYFDLKVFSDSIEAKATLYIFYDKTAQPVILTWFGKIGDEVSLSCEV